MSDPQANTELVLAFWDALRRRDFAGVGSYMSERGHYVDVPVLGVEEAAFGPAETEGGVLLVLEPLAGYVLEDGNIAASGDLVITEHAEEWTWSSGEHVRLPFTSGMEGRGGK